MSVTLTVTQQVELFLRPIDVRGNPAPVDGIPTWETSDSNLIDLVPSIDGLSAVVKARGGVGHVQITAVADARLGPEVRTLAGVLEIDLVPAEAVSLGLFASAPTEIEEPAPEPVPDPVAE